MKPKIIPSQSNTSNTIDFSEDERTSPPLSTIEKDGIKIGRSLKQNSSVLEMLCGQQLKWYMLPLFSNDYIYDSI